jgi:hypothetical protein
LLELEKATSAMKVRNDHAPKINVTFDATRLAARKEFVQGHLACEEACGSRYILKQASWIWVND